MRRFSIIPLAIAFALTVCPPSMAQEYYSGDAAPGEDPGDLSLDAPAHGNSGTTISGPNGGWGGETASGQIYYQEGRMTCSGIRNQTTGVAYVNCFH